MDAQTPHIRACIAHLSGPGAYFSARQRLAVSLEAAAALDACKACAGLRDTCLMPRTSVVTLLRNSGVVPAVPASTLPQDLVICIRAMINLQSKLTVEFYNDLVRAAQQYSTLKLTDSETKAAAAELIAVVSVTSSLTTLLESLGLHERFSLPDLSEIQDAQPIAARRLSAMGSTVVPGVTYGPLMSSLGSSPPGESNPMMLSQMPFRGLGLVPFEATFFDRWLAALYMEGWKVIFSAYGLGATATLDRAQMEVVAEHYAGTVGCAY